MIITSPCRKGPISLEEQRHFERLWFNPAGPYNHQGTQDLIDFILPIYKSFIEQENELLSSTSDSPNACSNRVFCRFDVTLVWDKHNNRYRYTINEVQGGIMGLFQHEQDSSMTLPWAFVDALERGAHWD